MKVGFPTIHKVEYVLGILVKLIVEVLLVISLESIYSKSPGTRKAPLALGVVKDPESADETCTPGLAPNSLVAKDTVTPS